MINTELQTKLEFLISFFSKPDFELMKQIRLGETPLGKISKSDSELSFEDEKMVLITELFVNSRTERPIFPLATEYLRNKREKESYLEQLIACYADDNKVTANYPPDHLKVLLEFLLYKLSDNDINGAKDFYTIFLKPWYTKFTEAILNRAVDSLAVELAGLVNAAMVQVEKM